MILTIRTDTNQTQLGLVDIKHKQIAAYGWESGRQLSQQLLFEIDRLLHQANIDQSDLSGIVVYQGPGSFTGLRIGITVANALAYGLNIPIAGGLGDSWASEAVKQITSQEFSMDQVVMPEYGAEANITKQKK